MHRRVRLPVPVGAGRPLRRVRSAGAEGRRGRRRPGRARPARCCITGTTKPGSPARSTHPGAVRQRGRASRCADRRRTKVPGRHAPRSGAARARASRSSSTAHAPPPNGPHVVGAHELERAARRQPLPVRGDRLTGAPVPPIARRRALEEVLPGGEHRSRKTTWLQDARRPRRRSRRHSAPMMPSRATSAVDPSGGLLLRARTAADPAAACRLSSAGRAPLS